MTNRSQIRHLCAFGLAVISLVHGASNSHAAAAKPLRILLITGGCCHDYARQKDILKQGIEERANATVDQLHTDDTSTRPPLAMLGNP